MQTICLMCPIGCSLTIEQKGEVIKVSGNTCPRGIKFGENELKNPKRIVTSIIKTKFGMISVKTNKEIAKSKIFECLKEIKKIDIDKELHFGEILIKNVCETGSDIVVTSNLVKY